MKRLLLACSAMTLLGSAVAAGAEPSDDPAVVFGTMPALWSARLSPDGSKLAFLQMHPEDVPILRIFDFETRKANIALASVPDEYDLDWCEWANTERLLCGYRGIEHQFYGQYVTTRLVAVDRDGGQQRVLLQGALRRQFAQIQDQIVDWLADDPKHVLVMTPGRDQRFEDPRNVAFGAPDFGTFGVDRLDIDTGTTRSKERPRDFAFRWISDGHGNPRIFLYSSAKRWAWYARAAKGGPWRVLYEAKTTSPAGEYTPIGFGNDPDTLLVRKPFEGRIALWEEPLGDPSAGRLVFAHPDVDVGGVLRLGKYRRIVAVAYSTDVDHLHYFDAAIEKITAEIGALLPGRSVRVVDESWDRKRYLVHAESDSDPGSYHLYDVASGELLRIAEQYPNVVGRPLGRMQPIRYPARDGTAIPGYLTLPAAGASKKLPTVILPHGGPQSRDYWGFDWIVQFLGAKGYAVLQSNYRGSGGYGETWAGEGGFRAWRLAVDDLAAGARHLITEGIADPNRICIAGWSYGGYAALMSAISDPSLYRCVVSIAGVTDPITLIHDYQDSFSKEAVREFVGSGDEVLEAGSPLRRAAELTVPVLLFHGDEDVNVSVEHGRKLASALERANRRVDYVEYEQVEHSIARNRYRVDLLRRMGSFLEANIGPSGPGPEAPRAAPGG